MNEYFDSENYYPDGCPKKCKYCGCEDITSRVEAIDGGHVSESSLSCWECSKPVGYWAYGSYEREVLV